MSFFSSLINILLNENNENNTVKSENNQDDNNIIIINKDELKWDDLHSIDLKTFDVYEYIKSCKREINPEIEQILDDYNEEEDEEDEEESDIKYRDKDKERKKKKKKKKKTKKEGDKDKINKQRNTVREMKKLYQFYAEKKSFKSKLYKKNRLSRKKRREKETLAQKIARERKFLNNIGVSKSLLKKFQKLLGVKVLKKLLKMLSKKGILSNKNLTKFYKKLSKLKKKFKFKKKQVVKDYYKIFNNKKYKVEKKRKSKLDKLKLKEHEITKSFNDKCNLVKKLENIYYNRFEKNLANSYFQKKLNDERNLMFDYQNQLTHLKNKKNSLGL